MEEIWQTFLLDGLPEWLPQAFQIASGCKDVKPRMALQWMIGEFVNPEHTRVASDEDLLVGLKSVARMMGTKFVD